MSFEVLPMLIISAIFLLLFIIAEIMRKTGKFCTEATRKFVHFSGAFVSIFFPFLLKSHISVLILSIVFAITMIFTKKFNLLPSIHNVDRKSYGAIYHPVAIYICFLIAQTLNQPYFYVISILILAISDASAALIGKNYGTRAFITESDKYKSLEGSFIFFLSSFLITHLILLLCTQTGRIESVLIALLIAIITTIFEGISLEGTDNIFVPLSTMFILSKNIDPTPMGIGLQILYLILFLLGSLLILKPYKKIGFSGVLLLSLISYIAFALAPWYYAFAIVMLAIVCQKSDWILIQDETKDEIFRILPVFFILAVPMMLILGADIYLTLSDKNVFVLFFIPFVYCLVSQMAILRGWKRKIQLQVPTKRSCSFFKSLVFTLIFSPLLFLNSKDYIVYAIISCISMSYFTDRIYWYYVLKNEEKWEQINFLKTGFRLTLISSIAILLIFLGVYNV